MRRNCGSRPHAQTTRAPIEVSSGRGLAGLRHDRGVVEARMDLPELRQPLV